MFLKNSYWPKNALIQPSKSLFGNATFRNTGGEKISDYVPLNTKLIKDRGIVINKIPNDSLGLFEGLDLEFDILGNKITGLPDLGAIEIK